MVDFFGLFFCFFCVLFFMEIFSDFFSARNTFFKPFAAAATSNHTNANSMQFSSPPLLLLVLPPLLYPLSFYAPVYLRCNVLVHVIVVVAALLEIQFCAAAAHDDVVDCAAAWRTKTISLTH